MKRGESMRSRGYTLIEIAGVMAVLGILLGASLLPLNRQMRESEYRQERVNMERLSDAVLGYALRHRTPGVGITMIDDMRGPSKTGFYAAGRPYLPCADESGDGIEDRRNLISPVLQTLTLSFLNATPRRLGTQEEQQALRDYLDLVDQGLADIRFAPIPERRGFPSIGFPEIRQVPIAYSGSCITSKGQLPWRTLGSIPADYWGNRYTYFADPVFSQEAIGFDEKTIADSGVRFLPRVLTHLGVYIPQKRSDRTIVDGRVFLGRPSIICDVAEAAGNSIDCGQNGSVAAPATLVAGEFAPTDGDGVFLKPEDLESSPPFPGDIADGLPFVIVSHGHNGFGAFNHLLSRREGGLECRSFDGISVGEAVNVYFYFGLTPNDRELLLNPDDPNEIEYERIINKLCSPGLHPDSPPNISRLFLRNLSPVLNEREGYFFAHRSDVSAARAASSLSDQKGVDDLLVWMTRGDLARRMREADVFPLIENDSDRPPVFYEPP